MEFGEAALLVVDLGVEAQDQEQTEAEAGDQHNVGDAERRAVGEAFDDQEIIDFFGKPKTNEYHCPEREPNGEAGFFDPALFVRTECFADAIDDEWRVKQNE